MRLLFLNLFLLINLMTNCSDQLVDQIEDDDLENHDLEKIQEPDLDQEQAYDLEGLLDQKASMKKTEVSQQIEPDDLDEQVLYQQELDKQELGLSKMPNTLNTMGFDDSGNWVEKRVYWERAEQAFGKVMALNAQVVQEQLQYFAMRNEADKQLDAGRCELGLNANDFNKVLDRLLSLLESDSNLTKNKQDNFKATVLEHKDQLLLLQNDLSELAQLDSDLDNVIMKVIDQARKCNEYEAKAWDDFKHIGRVLNDETAKKLYYQVVNYRKNSKLILNYLRVDLKKAFNLLVDRSKNKLAEIKKAAQELKEAGIDFAYELKALDNDLIYRTDRHDSSKEDEHEVKNESKKTKKPVGFWGALVDSLQFLWEIILWFPRKLFGLFGIKF